MLATFASISRLHIVAIAVLACFTFGWAFTGEHLWLIAAVCGLDWFLVNLLNRVVDHAEDQANRIRGADFASRHARALTWGGFGLLGASLVAVHAVMPMITPFRLAYHALGLAYNWPLLPGRRRIKQLYFWKNTASAMGFMLTVFAYPLAATGFAPRVPWTTICVVAAFFFLFELSYEVIYDLRDAPGDALADVRTYPVVHGERGAVRIIDGLIAMSSATLVGGYLAGVVPWHLAVMAVGPVLQVVLYKRALRRGISSADCVAITWIGAGLLLAYNLWQAAGLPGAV